MAGPGRPKKTVDQSNVDASKSEAKEIQKTEDGAPAMEAEEVQTEKTVSKKTKGTPPTWKPASQLPNLKAPPGFHAKWSNPAKLTERLSEGWIIMKPEDNKGERIVNMDVNDSTSLTGALKYRDLVAIMLPNELKKARDEYIRNENKEAMKGVLRDTDEKFKEHGVETYAPAGQSGRIVIN